MDTLFDLTEIENLKNESNVKYDSYWNNRKRHESSEYVYSRENIRRGKMNKKRMFFNKILI